MLIHITYKYTYYTWDNATSHMMRAEGPSPPPLPSSSSFPPGWCFYTGFAHMHGLMSHVCMVHAHKTTSKPQNHTGAPPLRPPIQP